MLWSVQEPGSCFGPSQNPDPQKKKGESSHSARPEGWAGFLHNGFTTVWFWLRAVRVGTADALERAVFAGRSTSERGAVRTAASGRRPCALSWESPTFLLPASEKKLPRIPLPPSPPRGSFFSPLPWVRVPRRKNSREGASGGEGVSSPSWFGFGHLPGLSVRFDWDRPADLPGTDPAGFPFEREWRRRSQGRVNRR